MSLDDFTRVPLLFGTSPVHPLPGLGAALGGRVGIWPGLRMADLYDVRSTQ